ncbi:MAG: OmpA family protein [Muribaculaceae bacterium]
MKGTRVFIAAIMLAIGFGSIRGADTHTVAHQNAVTAGFAAMSPIKGNFINNLRPALAIDFSHRLNHAFGIGIESLWAFNTSRLFSAMHSSTAIDNAYVGPYAFCDFMGNRNNSPINFGITAGCGWGHSFSHLEGYDHNFFATRAGLFLDYNFTPEFTLSLRPSFLWNMSDGGAAQSSVSYNASRCAFVFQAGLKYRFGDGFVYCRKSSADTDLPGLNSEVNSLRQRCDSLQQVISTVRPSGDVIQEVTINNHNNTVYDIFFRAGSAVVEADQMTNVERIAMQLKQNLKATVLIMGYASKDGAHDSNLKLSLDRALAVRLLLMSRYGIDASRINAQGCGEGHIFTEESWNRVCICTIKLTL